MDLGREKEAFVTLKIKGTIAQKFRTFCKNNAASQSMSLLQMIQFFEFNGIAPTDNLGDSIAKLEGKINKRTNAIIAIIKNIEKKRISPTYALLLSLFEEKLEDDEPQFVEKKFADTNKNKIIEEEEESYDFGQPNLITENEELSYYQNAFYKAQEEHQTLKYKFEAILKQTKYIKSSFGKNYYRLDITKQEFEAFLDNLNK